LQNRLIQTSQTGGQRYSDTSPFSIPCLGLLSAQGLEGRGFESTLKSAQKKERREKIVMNNIEAKNEH